MNHRAKQHWLKEFLNKYPQAIAYLGLGLILVLIFTLQTISNHNTFKSLCVSGIDSRNVDRDQMQRIYNLAVSTLPKNNEGLTKDQIKRLNAYVKQVQKFRDESFATIKPSEACKPFVDDDVVTPEQWAKEHPPKPLNES